MDNFQNLNLPPMPPNATPEEIEAWQQMMGTMVTFIQASTHLMNTINNKVEKQIQAAVSHMSAPPGTVAGNDPGCVPECVEYVPKPTCGVCGKPQSKRPSRQGSTTSQSSNVQKKESGTTPSKEPSTTVEETGSFHSTEEVESSRPDVVPEEPEEEEKEEVAAPPTEAPAEDPVEELTEEPADEPAEAAETPADDDTTAADETLTENPPEEDANEDATIAPELPPEGGDAAEGEEQPGGEEAGSPKGSKEPSKKSSVATTGSKPSQASVSKKCSCARTKEGQQKARMRKLSGSKCGCSRKPSEKLSIPPMVEGCSSRQRQVTPAPSKSSGCCCGVGCGSKSLSQQMPTPPPPPSALAAPSCFCDKETIKTPKPSLEKTPPPPTPKKESQTSAKVLVSSCYCDKTDKATMQSPKPSATKPPEAPPPKKESAAGPRKSVCGCPVKEPQAVTPPKKPSKTEAPAEPKPQEGGDVPLDCPCRKKREMDKKALDEAAACPCNKLKKKVEGEKPKGPCVCSKEKPPQPSCLCGDKTEKPQGGEDELSDDDFMVKEPEEEDSPCFCPPTEKERMKLAADLEEKLDNARKDIELLQEQMRKLQRMDPNRKIGPNGGPSPAALYKEIMRGAPDTTGPTTGQCPSPTLCAPQGGRGGVSSSMVMTPRAPPIRSAMARITGTPIRSGSGMASYRSQPDQARNRLPCTDSLPEDSFMRYAEPSRNSSKPMACGPEPNPPSPSDMYNDMTYTPCPTKGGTAYNSSGYSNYPPSPYQPSSRTQQGYNNSSYGKGGLPFDMPNLAPCVFRKPPTSPVKQAMDYPASGYTTESDCSCED